MKNIFIAVAIIAVASLGFFLLKSYPGSNVANALLLQDQEVTVYKSPTCGCCGKYVSYLKDQGAKVAVHETEEMNEVKSRHRVPTLLESCHTAIIDGYVVEGHVPAEAIRKLLDEKPPIAGISLPEMPAGSPGMGGTKSAPFHIQRITSDGKDGGMFVEL